LVANVCPQLVKVEQLPKALFLFGHADDIASSIMLEVSTPPPANNPPKQLFDNPVVKLPP